MTPLGFDEAFARMRDAISPLGSEVVALEQALGRVASEPIAARLTMPRQDVSAMDGYAMREADASDIPFRLPVCGEIAAGAAPGAVLCDGAMARIYTGAPLPASADLVIMQENVARHGDHATVERAFGPGRHIRKAGSDFMIGDEMIAAGQMLSWKALTTIAGADVAEAKVYKQPRVAILATGDELALPGTARAQSGKIPESVSYGVRAFVDLYGGKTVWRQSVPDSPDLLRAAARSAVEISDLVIVIGGASVGERDYSRAIFDEDLEYVFPKVAIKPGKPVWMARSAGRWVLGLPGNPTAALVTARLFLGPLLAGLTGRDPSALLEFSSMELMSELPATKGRESFVRGQRVGHGVRALAKQDSSNQSVLARADVLIRRPPDDPARAPGETVSVLDF
ncbi:MAG: molybdopterin molybdotransferase MoeA [Hyphomonadaceae bacterium]|nr:molybdopterin molybdotransferase MoeA [Hyphomonadaceae bacterium]